MAGEIQASYQHGATVYALIFNSTGQVWNTVGLVFENYLTANYSQYPIQMVEQGVASAFFLGNFPSQIVAGVYSVPVKNQFAGMPAETDGAIGGGNIEWNGSIVAPLAYAATSGQVAQVGPIKIYRGEMVNNFMFKLVSSVDHVTPFTSGICSGMIARDGTSFGPFQSGAYNEIGFGWYNLQAMTSGDLSANSVALTFFAAGVSGGTSDPRDFGLILQKTSGYN